MKAREGLRCGLALAVLAAWPVGDALAASVSGRASTVVEWFDDADEDTVVPIFQYLQLNVLDLADQGYNFHVYGRAGEDLADEREISADSRLYYAYLDKKGFLTESLDFRLGRQFITTTAGASLMDGARIDYGYLGNYRFTLFGGGDVAYYEGYNLKDAILGGEVAGRFLDDDLNLGLSYFSKWDEGLLAQELFGFDATYDWRDTLYLYNETQFDYLSDRISYLLLGGKYHQSDNWTGRVEYLYSLPVFSSTSIYSVFAVEEYEEVMGEVTYRFGQGLRVFGRFTREIYEEFSDANVFEAGIEKIRTGRISGYLAGVIRDDDQDLRGVKAHAGYLINDYVQAGIGAEVDVLDRQLNFFDLDGATDETTASRLWIDTTLTLTEKINLQAKVERIESDLWDHYYRGRVRLNIFF